MTDEEQKDLEGHVPAEEESSLLNRRTLLIAAGGLLAMIIFVHLAGAIIYGLFVIVSPEVDEQPGLPPEPRLQVAPAQDLQILQATEGALLSAYTVLDREGNVVRIPIERAMELIAERGLPVFEGEVVPEGRIEADESGFPNSTLEPPAEPGAAGTPLLEVTVSSTTILTSTQTVPATPRVEESPIPESTQEPGASMLPSNVSQVRPVASTSAGKTAPPDPIEQVGFDQRLNAQVPLDLAFRDEGASTVRLREFFNRKPVILFFAYYECPMLCTLVLNDLTETLQDLEFELGEQFEVITVSMDARETPQLAAAKKAVYLNAYGRPGTEGGWHFLTGDELAIQQLAETVGFRFAYDEQLDQYAHPTGIMVLTPEGKISHYFFGIDYPANDLRLALVEASTGKIGTPVDQFFLLCYAYNPVTGRYSLLIGNVLRLAGAVTVLGLAVIVLGMILRERRGKIMPSSRHVHSPADEIERERQD